MRSRQRLRGVRAARPGPAPRYAGYPRRSGRTLGSAPALAALNLAGLIAAGLLASCAAVPEGSGTPSGPATSVPAPDAGASCTATRPSEQVSASLPALVADARWVVREGERALVVTPTPYLREHGETAVAREAWRRVVAAVPEADTPGMQDQFVCHVQFAAAKPGWYLEPRRPAVGYSRTVLAGCNPGEVPDVG